MKGILISFLPSVYAVKGLLFVYKGTWMGIHLVVVLHGWVFIWLLFFKFLQNEGWRTPPQEHFKLTSVVKNISFQKV